MTVLKLYLDSWGPYAVRGRGGSVAQTLQQSALRFWEGGAAPFPVFHSSASHRAQHLLLDCTLPTPLKARLHPARKGATEEEDAEAGGGGGGGAKYGAKFGSGDEECALEAEYSGAEFLEEVAGILEEAMREAGLPPHRRQLQSFASFRTRRAGLAGAQRQEPPPHMLYLGCPDGYVTTIWCVRARATAAGKSACCRAWSSRGRQRTLTPMLLHAALGCAASVQARRHGDAVAGPAGHQ